MSCYSPRSVIMDSNNKIIKWHQLNEKEDGIEYRNKNWEKMNLIPCSKCIGCKVDYAQEWAKRATLHAKYTKNNYFITLTYNNENLPLNKNGKPTIKSKDLTQFIKSLRNHFERQNHTGIKYLAGSEYGRKSKTQRPHYHICFFNLPLTDLVPTNETNKIGQPYYTSKSIDKIWHKGMHKIGNVEYESAGYVARYTFKKLKKIDYKLEEIEPESLRMSNGIGLEYWEKNKNEILRTDKVIIKNNKGVKSVKPPKYYDRKIKETMPDEWKELKEKRTKNSITQTKTKLEQSEITYTNYMAEEQRKLHKNLKKLKRPLINKQSNQLI